MSEIVCKTEQQWKDWATDIVEGYATGARGGDGGDILTWGLVFDNKADLMFHDMPCFGWLQNPRVDDCCYGSPDDMSSNHPFYKYLEGDRQTVNVTDFYLPIRRPFNYFGWDFDDADGEGGRPSDDFEYDYEDEDDFDDYSKKTLIKGSFEPYDAGLAKAARTFYNFIFDKKYSPYRSIISELKVYRDKNKHPYLIHLPIKAGMSANMVVSFLSATRIPWLQKGHLMMWDLMRKSGFTRVESYYITAHVRFGQLYDKIVPKFRHAYGHFPYNSLDGQLSLAVFKSGVPIKDISGDFRLFRSYEDLGSLFGKRAEKTNRFDYAGRKASNAASKEKGCALLQLLQPSSDYNGVFKTSYSKNVSKELGILNGFNLSMDDFVKKLKETKDTWRTF